MTSLLFFAALPGSAACSLRQTPLLGHDRWIARVDGERVDRGVASAAKWKLGCIFQHLAREEIASGRISLEAVAEASALYLAQRMEALKHGLDFTQAELRAWARGELNRRNEREAANG